MEQATNILLEQSNNAFESDIMFGAVAVSSDESDAEVSMQLDSFQV